MKTTIPESEHADTLNIITWWVFARIYESSIEHQSDPLVHAWLYDFMRLMSDQAHMMLDKGLAARYA